MDRYIAVDSGKYATKVAVYDPAKEETTKFKFRTKTSKGYFEDDAIESATFISEIGGEVYKIGNGASEQASFETSKMSEIHKRCVLSAIAMCTSANEVDNVHVAIGMPVRDFEVVTKRNEYRDFMLPEGEVTVTLKTKNETKPEKKTFKIVTRLVCPESSGALYIDPVRFKNATTGVLDIGNLNLNGTLWNGFDPDNDYSITDELGGSVLIENLSQILSAEFSRCDANRVASVLMKPLPERKLVPTNHDPEIEERSAQIITEYLMQHVKEIKRRCDSKHWSLNFIELAFIGGTSRLLSNEIKAVFGETAIVFNDPEYANVVGFLTKLCSRKLNIMIPAAKNAVSQMESGEKFPEKGQKTNGKGKVA